MNGKDILAALLQDISSGMFSTDKKLPSEAALCSHFGVSRMTVRGALEELQRRGLIEKRNGAGSFLTQRALRKSGIIGLVIPDYNRFEFFATVRHEVTQHCSRLNYHVELVTTDETVQDKAIADIRRKIRQLAARRAEGVIFRPFVTSKSDEANLEMVRILRNAEVPVVLIDSDITKPPERSDCDLVAVNNVEAGRRIADHLYDGGCRHFAFLMPGKTLADNPNWNNRLFGLAGELALLGCEDGVRTLRFSASDKTALASALRGHPQPDAIVCGNDETAVALIKALNALGKRIPKDIAVVGFDDLPLAKQTKPPLTTISQPVRKIAATAFKVLLARIRYPNNDPRETYLAAPLIVRGSTRIGDEPGTELPPRPKNLPCTD